MFSKKSSQPGESSKQIVEQSLKHPEPESGAGAADKDDQDEDTMDITIS